MPIYVYKCSSCDHAQDVLQKMSDPILTVCPGCKQDTYVKQVTSAGFQLKGTGWYVTDFRDNKSGATDATGATAPAAAAGGDASSASAPSSSPVAAPAASPAAPSSSS